MNQLSLITQAVRTMSSLELVGFINEEREKDAKHAGAEFPSKGFAALDHSDFLKKVPQVLGGDGGNFSAIYLDSMNREKPCYQFPKREACLMAMSYSYELQAKVFDKMTALEQQAAAAPALPNFADPVAAARAWADAMELATGTAAALSLAAPKAQALDRLTLADGSMCITNAAKSLGVQPKHLFSWMQKNDWIYRRPGCATWIAYQQRLKTGVLDHKVTTVEKQDGSEKIVAQVLVTAKGLARLAELVGEVMA